MIIKRYSEQYLKALLDTLRRFRDEDKKNNYPKEYKNITAYTLDYLVNPQYSVLLALKDGKVAGYLIGEDLDSNRYSLKFIFVQPFYRLEHAGTSLIGNIEDHARKTCHDSIESRVARFNMPSIRLHERAGWSRQDLDRRFYRFYKKL